MSAIETKPARGAEMRRAVSRRLRRALGAWALLVLGPGVANASFLAGDALDTMADWLAIFVLIVVPVGGIVLFWLVHILPEKIAEKKHHPQKDAIKTLCLLSLVFGGLLWPIAWLWAYTKPVLHKMAYGTDKHEDYYKELARDAGRRCARAEGRRGAPARGARRPGGERRGARGAGRRSASSSSALEARLIEPRAAGQRGA